MGLLAPSQTLPSTDYPTYTIHCMLFVSPLCQSCNHLMFRDWSVSVCSRWAWRIGRLPRQSCSKPANPTWIYQRNIIVSQLLMWLEDHTNVWDQLVYPRYFRARQRAVCCFTYQCVVRMTLCIRTVESVSNLVNQSTHIIGPCVLILLNIDHINLILHCNPL